MSAPGRILQMTPAPGWRARFRDDLGGFTAPVAVFALVEWREGGQFCTEVRPFCGDEGGLWDASENDGYDGIEFVEVSPSARPAAPVEG